MLHVGFLNKNTFRKYPIRADSSWVASNGTVMPFALLSGARITTTVGHANVYISKIYIKNNYINLTITHLNNDLTEVLLGYCSAAIKDNYQAMPLSPVQNYASGTLIFGELSSLSGLDGSYFFSLSQAKLEDSTVVVVPVPAVQAITGRTGTATGNVTLTLDNISEILTDVQLNLDVINKRTIISKSDVEINRLNCGGNIITGINTVVPDAEGNIDIFGILPVQISVDPFGGVQLVTPGLGFTDICPNTDNIPPIPATNQQVYPPIVTATNPEWKTWPQFQGTWDQIT